MLRILTTFYTLLIYGVTFTPLSKYLAAVSHPPTQPAFCIMAEMYSGLHVNQQFSSLDEFKTVIRNISVRQHWELRVSRSNKKSVVIGCRSSPNCYFRVVCRANRNVTYISSLQDSHSCRRNAASPGTTPARAEASHVRFLLSEIPRLFDMRDKIKGQDVVDAVKRYHGYDISMRQAQRALTKLQPRQAQSQNEEILSQDGSIGDHQGGKRQRPDPQRDDSDYSGLSEDRWMPDQLQPGLMGDGYVQQNEARHNPGPPQPSIQHAPRPQVQPAPYLQRPTQVQTHPQVPAQELAPLNSNVTSHPHFPRVAPDQIPAPPPDQPKPPRQPQAGGHAAGPQMVLTNFKIEFTCTTCGSLNQSFFPNQGNVASNPSNYLSPHPPSNQAGIVGHPGSTAQNAPESSGSNVRDTGGYERATANTRDLRASWAPGGLNVPMAPTHT